MFLKTFEENEDIQNAVSLIYRSLNTGTNFRQHCCDAVKGLFTAVKYSYILNYDDLTGMLNAVSFFHYYP